MILERQGLDPTISLVIILDHKMLPNQQFYVMIFPCGQIGRGVVYGFEATVSHPADYLR